MKWMEANQLYKNARYLTYAEFPTKWVWKDNLKEWKMREVGKSIGRISYIHPAVEELFFLRKLIDVARGPVVFRNCKQWMELYMTHFKQLVLH